MKTSENLSGFLMFSGGIEETSGMKWVHASAIISQYSLTMFSFTIYDLIGQVLKLNFGLEGKNSTF